MVKAWSKFGQNLPWRLHRSNPALYAEAQEPGRERRGREGGSSRAAVVTKARQQGVGGPSSKGPYKPSIQRESVERR
ncbi:MAG TPA: hypothetical protein DCP08_00615 [Chloroflexi bacterium]|nr:hypothetical protein [Chloroflexota bacterium]